MNIPKKIVVLSLIPHTVGDTLLLTPMFKILKKNFPNSYVGVTSSPFNSDLLKNHPDIDKIMIIDELGEISVKNIGKIKKLMIYFRMMYKLKNILKSEGFDTAFVTLPNFPLSHLIPYLAGIKNTYGYRFKGSFFSFLLTRNIKFVNLYVTGKHYINYNIDLLNLAGLKWDAKDVVSTRTVSSKEISRANFFLKKKGVKRRFVSFQPGAKGAPWAPERFADLADRLISKGYDVLLLGSPEEKNLGEKIKGFSKKPKHIFNFCQKGLTLADSAAFLKLSKLAICNDSGLAHLTSSVGTNLVDLFGPTFPSHAVPIGPGKVKVIYKDAKECCRKRGACINNYICMRLISVDEVFDATNRFLRG